MYAFSNKESAKYCPVTILFFQESNKNIKFDFKIVCRFKLICEKVVFLKTN